MNTRAKGRHNEIRTKNVLVALGYDVCLAPNPSKFCLENDQFGLYDLIAVNAGTVRWIQVKSNQGASPKKRKMMEDWACPSNTFKEIWIWKDRVKLPEIRVWNGTVWSKERNVV